MIPPEHYAYWTIGAALLCAANLYALLEGWRAIWIRVTSKTPATDRWEPGSLHKGPDGRLYKAIAGPNWKIASLVPVDTDEAQEMPPHAGQKPIRVTQGKKLLHTIER